MTGFLRGSVTRVPYLEELYKERNTEKLNLSGIALKRLQMPWKQKLYTQQEKVSRFYYFFPLFWTIPYDRYISHTNSYNNAITQCMLTDAQRAWATCVLTWCYNHCIQKLSNHWWTPCYHFGNTISYHSSNMTCKKNILYCNFKGL